MSGCGYITNCPNCGAEAYAYSDYKPYDCVDIYCYECGFFAYTKSGFLNLNELNLMRADNGLEPLTELPNQDFE